MTHIVGIDLSLTATGLCVDGTCDTIKLKTVGMDRLDRIRMNVLEAVDGASLVVVEGYAMGTARQSGTYAVGELGGLIRWSLWDHDIPYVEVPPATLKQFATGKGNANKDAMVATAARLGCPADDNNAVDAWWLWHMGRHAYSGGTHKNWPNDRDARAAAQAWGVPATAYRDKAVAAITWPSVGTAA